MSCGDFGMITSGDSCNYPQVVPWSLAALKIDSMSANRQRAKRHLPVNMCGKRSGFRTSWSGSAGSARAPGLPGQEVREALGFPDFLVRKCGKRSGSRTSWSGSAGSARAPGLPGQEVREALGFPDFLVRKCGKRSGSRTSWSGSAGSARVPGLPGQEVREALGLPDFLVRKCGKRSGSRTSWSGSAGSARLPDFLVSMCGKQKKSMTSLARLAMDCVVLKMPVKQKSLRGFRPRRLRRRQHNVVSHSFCSPYEFLRSNKENIKTDGARRAAKK